MDLKKLQTTVIKALESVKAQDIRIFDTSATNTLFDRIVITSGTSNRHTRALARAVHDQVKQKDGTIIGVEGEENGEWVLIDLGEIVVHVMQPVIRAYYHIEDIWAEHEVVIRKKAARSKTQSTQTPSKRTTLKSKTSKTESSTTAEPKKTRSRTSTSKTAAPKATVSKISKVSKSSTASKKPLSKADAPSAPPKPAKKTPAKTSTSKVSTAKTATEKSKPKVVSKTSTTARKKVSSSASTRAKKS